MKILLKRVLQNYKQYFLLMLLLVISLFLLPLNSNPDIKNIQKVAFGTFAIVNSISEEMIDTFTSDEALLEQRKLNAELMMRLNLLREQGLENADLRDMLEYKKNEISPLVPVRVISKIINDVQGNFILNRGRSDSIKVGMPLLSEKGLVGMITSVTNDFSLARTIKNSDFKLAVTVQKSNIEGIINWDGEYLVVRNIPITSSVNEGDRIVTSDFSTILPPSIPVGYVVGSRVSISGIFKEILAIPYADIDGSRNLFIMKIVKSEQVDSLELNLFKEH